MAGAQVFQKNVFQNNVFQVGAVTTSTTTGTGGWGAGGLVGYKKKSHPADTYVRKLSELDPPQPETVADVETNEQTPELEAAIDLREPAAYASARARMNERLRLQEEIRAKELRARQIEDENETFLMLA